MKTKIVLLALLAVEALSVVVFRAPAQAKSSLKGVVITDTDSNGGERTEAK